MNNNDIYEKNKTSIMLRRQVGDYVIREHKTYQRSFALLYLTQLENFIEASIHSKAVFTDKQFIALDMLENKINKYIHDLNDDDKQEIIDKYDKLRKSIPKLVK